MKLSAIVDSLDFIRTAKNPDSEIEKHIKALSAFFGSSNFMGLLFYPDRKMTLREIAERALEMKASGERYKTPSEPLDWWGDYTSPLE